MIKYNLPSIEYLGSALNELSRFKTQFEAGIDDLNMPEALVGLVNHKIGELENIVIEVLHEATSDTEELLDE